MLMQTDHQANAVNRLRIHTINRLLVHETIKISNASAPGSFDLPGLKQCGTF